MFFPAFRTRPCPGREPRWRYAGELRAGLAFCGPLLSSRRERSMDAGVRIRSPARARLKSDNPLRDLAVTNP